jgi:pSer/pThr/pTyr-binding forkhead associated (FHA) protein
VSISDSNAVAEAERSGRPYLLFSDRDGRQRLFVFAADSSSAIVGRRSTSDLVLDWDDQVSRLHARFELVDGTWVIVDDGLSSNGTFINQERLNGKRRLSDGDNVRFGSTTVTFHAPAAQPVAPAPAPAPVRAPDTAPPPRRDPGVSLSSTQRRVLAALCRPYKGQGGFASPASNEEIAEELFLSPGEVGAHLRVLTAKFGLVDQSAAESRVRLVERAFATGLISENDL